MERRSPALQDTRAKIDECLHRAKLAGPQVRVVPLTGDASTRQYFRILRPDNPSVVLAVSDAPFVFDELPFVKFALGTEEQLLREPLLLNTNIQCLEELRLVRA